MPKLPKLIRVGYLGIDPGKSGGLAWLDHRGQLVTKCKMPAEDEHLLEVVGSYATWNPAPDYVCCVMERVSSMPGEGHRGAFTFGEGFGKLKMALTAARVPYQLSNLTQVGKMLGLRSRQKGELKTHWKHYLRGEAERLFPQETIALWAADALLFAHYCYELHRKR